MVTKTSKTKAVPTQDFTVEMRPRVPATDSDGLYLGRSVKLGSVTIRMSVDELPEEVQKRIPEALRGEEVKGNINVFVPIPQDEREESYRWKGK